MTQQTKKRIQQLLTAYIVVMLVVLIAVIIFVARREVQTSQYQAKYLSQISKQLAYKLAPGSSDTISYPKYGPYDERLGYTLLPNAIERLKDAGYSVASQAVFCYTNTIVIVIQLSPPPLFRGRAGWEYNI